MRSTPAAVIAEYASEQVDEGRLLAMLRAIDMPLVDVAEALAASQKERSRIVSRYWYRIEPELDEYRETVRAVRSLGRRRQIEMGHSAGALERGHK